MIIEPMLRGALCANAHPDGCAERVRRDIGYVQERTGLTGANRPRNVLVIGGSSGLGFAARIAASVAADAATINVCQERPGTSTRTATAGWYNTAALEEELSRGGLYARTVLGDAFSDATKEQTAQAIRDDLGTVDLVVYSLAAPSRTHPETGRTHRSALKSIGKSFTAKTYDSATGSVGQATVGPALDEEIQDTITVMGGDDWHRWIDTLQAAKVLSPWARTVAFSYVGNTALAPTYRAGTLGRAKEHLESTGRELDARLRPTGGRAVTAVMRAMVTQASQVIPAQTLYTVILGRVMREAGLQEGPIEQACRLLMTGLYPGGDGPSADPVRHAVTDELGRLRLDDLELRPDIQEEVDRRLMLVDSHTVARFGDPDAYRAESLALNGFGLTGVDYAADTDPIWPLTDPIHVVNGSVRAPHD